MKLLRALVLLLPIACFGQVTGTIPSTGGGAACVNIAVGPKGSQVAITVTGTWSGTLQPKVSVQGQAAANTQVTPSTSSTAASTITANGTYFTVNVAGADTFYLCGNTVASGTASVYLNISTASAKGGGGGGGSGTVTSVTFTGDGVVGSSTPSSAVTTSGTVTATIKTQAANTVLGNATASTAAPTFTSNPSVSTVVLNGATSGTATLSASATGGTLNLGSTNATVTSAGVISGTGFVGTSAGGVGNNWLCAEGTDPGTEATGKDLFWCDSATHRMLLSNNNGTSFPATQTIGAGTITVTGDAPTAGACATEHTVAITGLLTTDLVRAGFNGDPTAVTGIAPVTTGGVYIVAYPKSAGTLGLKVCNDTSATITVGTLVLNYSVTR